jgi:DNA repair protein RecO (recombination protein O)
LTAKIDLQPAYVLHTQPFQNTSLLVDFFTIDYGRVRAVAKGARRSSSRIKPYLQAFQPLLVGLSGRNELKNMTAVEGSINALTLIGTRLFCGMYINELMVRLVHGNEPYPELYESYQQTLVGLHGDRDVEQILRRFEFNLLIELGYGIDMEIDIQSGSGIEKSKHYLFHPDRGFEAMAGASAAGGNNANVFSGSDILLIRDALTTTIAHPQASRRLARQALQFYLGDKPLMSRALFAKKS